MLYKIAVIIFAIWIVIYEISYALYEYKQKNKAAATGVALLSAIVLLLSLAAITV